jgi:hypothetical protein
VIVDPVPKEHLRGPFIDATLSLPSISVGKSNCRSSASALERNDPDGNFGFRYDLPYLSLTRVNLRIAQNRNRDAGRCGSRGTAGRVAGEA